MNVLIVDKDKSFARSLSLLFNEVQDNNKIYYYPKLDDEALFLCENQIHYDLKLISLDSISKNDINVISNNSNLIGISPDSKTTKKFINNPCIQRVFQKPVDMIIIAKYLDKCFDYNFSNKNYSVNVLNTLSKLGFSVNNSGTIYLSECIIEAKRNYYYKLNDIASVVAKKNNVSTEIVIWSIRNAINRNIRLNGEDYLCKALRLYDGRKPTPKYIIDYFSSII